MNKAAMRYHLRLWGRAALVQLLVIALTALTCAAATMSLLVDEVARNRLAYLETLDAYVQKVFYAAQHELIAMGERTDWLSLARRSSMETGRGSLEAREEINMRLIESISGNSYFKTMYFITPEHLYTSGFGNVVMQRAQGSASTWFRDGIEMRNTLMLSLGENSYLVAKLDIEQAFSEDAENLYVMNHEGNCIYAVAQSAYMEGWFEDRGEALAQSGAPGDGLYVIDGKLYRLVVYESVPYDRLYLSLTPVEDTLRVSQESLKKLMILAFALAMVMLAALYYASWLAMRPVRWMADRVRRETSLEALSGQRFSQHRMRGRLRWRVMCVFLLTLVPVAIMPLSTFAIFSRSSVQYTQEFYQLSMTKTAQNVGFSYSQLLRQAAKVRASSELRDWMKDHGEGTADREELLEIALDLLSGMDGVTGMRMYDMDGEVLLTATPFEKILTDNLLEEYQNTFRYITVSTSNLKDNDLAVLFPLRITTTDGRYRLFSCIGYVELHAEASTAGNLVNAATSGQELWYLYDSASWQLLDVPMTTANRRLVEGLAQAGMIAGDGQPSMRIVKATEDGNPRHARDYLLLSEPVPNTSWHVIALLSSDFLKGTEAILGAAMVLLMAVLTLVFAAMSNLFTRRFMRSVWRLVMYFTTATPQDSQMPATLEDEGEITLIAREFEGALMRIGQLEEMERRQQEEKLYLEKRKRDAEIVALQSQLDSHLISNLFASMQLLLRMNEMQTLDNTLRVVARFFRNEMAMDSMDVPLAKEIALTRSYVEVQKTRFHEALQVVWAEYDASLEQLIVPKFIMQPVLENAIKHGMSTDRVMEIHISIASEDGRLTILIANNGCPVDENQVEPINQRIDDTAPTTHIGLRNIMERLRLRYGTEESGVRLSSDADGWIRVCIWLPCQESEER